MTWQRKQNCADFFLANRTMSNEGAYTYINRNESDHCVFSSPAFIVFALLYFPPKISSIYLAFKAVEVVMATARYTAPTVYSIPYHSLYYSQMYFILLTLDSIWWFGSIFFCFLIGCWSRLFCFLIWLDLTRYYRKHIAQSAVTRRIHPV